MVPARGYDVRDPPPREAQGGRCRPPHLPARGRDVASRALPFSLVGSAPGPDGGDPVPLGDLVLDPDPVVREGREHHLRGSSRWFEQVGDHDLLQDAVLSTVVELLEVAADYGLVLFGHALPLRLSGEPTRAQLVKAPISSRMLG